MNINYSYQKWIKMKFNITFLVLMYSFLVFLNGCGSGGAAGGTGVPPQNSGPEITTVRVSVSSNGTQGNLTSMASSMSVDGVFTAFESLATNLVSGDTNNEKDIFVHNLDTTETTLVSVKTDGTQGNNSSSAPAISADGRVVAFESLASNLVSVDTNGLSDIFVHNRDTGITTLVSVKTDGTQGNNSSSAPAISADGRIVVFESLASNLLSGDTDSLSDIIVHDLFTGKITHVSVAKGGVQGNKSSTASAISADGRVVVFESIGINGLSDIFVHDLVTTETTRVSVKTGGTLGNKSSFAPSISADGGFVVFESSASNLVDDDDNNRSDIFVYERSTGNTTRVSVKTDGTQGNFSSTSPAISEDGRYVVFESTSNNLVQEDTNGSSDIFLHDRDTGTTTLVSVNSSGTQGNFSSTAPAVRISSESKYISFTSSASNLVDGDTNGALDVFIHIITD